MNASTKFYKIINNNIDLEFKLISFFRSEYESEYEYNCDRQFIRDAIIAVFDITHRAKDFCQVIDEYCTYLAIRIYA